MGLRVDLILEMEPRLDLNSYSLINKNLLQMPSLLVDLLLFLVTNGGGRTSWCSLITARFTLSTFENQPTGETASVDLVK
jgi:hypothetical protein